MGERRFKILVCRGPECGERRNSQAVFDAFERLVQKHPACSGVVMDRWSCFGRCTQGPNVLVQQVIDPPANQRRFVLATAPRSRRGRSVLYNGVSPADAVDILRDHVLGGKPVARLIQAPARSQSYNGSGSAAEVAAAGGGDRQGES